MKKTDSTVVLTGAEMRSVLFPKLEAETAAVMSGLPKTGEVARRVVRVYLRFAAKLAVSFGMPPQFFVAECIEAVKKEIASAAPVAQEASPEVAVEAPKKGELLN